MGHWYDAGGEPRHFEGKNGNGTTLREARKLNLYPSVTTIGNVKSKFQLTNWLQEEAAMTAADMLCDSDGSIVTDRQWARTVVKASRDKTMAKADEGTDIHDILEKFQVDPYCQEGINNRALCDAVALCIMENTGLGIHGGFYSEMRFCDTHHGYAGMCDLHSQHFNGTYAGREPDKDEWIIDYKSKDTVDAKTRGYKEQAEQLAAYAHGLERPKARLANIFISRTPPPEGEPWPVQWFEHKDEWAWERFLQTLKLWQVENKFGPYFDEINDNRD